MKGGHKGHVAYVWSWAELTKEQQEIVSRKLLAAMGSMITNFAMHEMRATLDTHCSAVMTDDDALQIVIGVPLNGFEHPEMAK